MTAKRSRQRVATQAADQPVSVEAEPGEPISSEPELASTGPAYVESPHGRTEGWSAVHGDQNAAADSTARSTVAADLWRGLNPLADNGTAEEFREGADLAEEREAENERSLQLASDEEVVYLTAPDPDDSEA